MPIRVCVDTGCGFTTVSARFVSHQTLFDCMVKQVCANGQSEVIKHYTYLLLRVTEDLSLEVQALVAPEADDAPDLLLGRDCLQKLGAVISMEDSLIDLAGFVIPLSDHRDPGTCETVIVPPLSLSSALSISLAPGEVTEIPVAISGSVLARHYLASSTLPGLVFLTSTYDLKGYHPRCYGLNDVGYFSSFVHNSGTQVLSLSKRQVIASLRPTPHRHVGGPIIGRSGRPSSSVPYGFTATRSILRRP